VGGGWVHGSMPEAEFEETALKERAVRAAFGLEVAHAG
jgi:isochorismate synthase EntC